MHKEERLNYLFHEVVCFSINDIMIIIYFKVLFLHFFRKFFISTTTGNLILGPCNHFKENFDFEIENILIIFVIHILMMGTVFWKKKKKNEHLMWTGSKMKNARTIKRIYHIVLSYNYVDQYIQFYLFLSLPRKDIKFE